MRQCNIIMMRRKRDGLKANERRDLFDIRSGKELLVLLLAIGGVVTIMGTAPWLLAGLPAVKILSDTPKDRGRVRNAFWYAKKRNYISSHTLHVGAMTISLTKEGMRAARMNLMKIKVQRASQRRAWDGKWRLLLFDVSMKEHAKRNAFRHLIRRLGAVKLQQSVWIYPHDCSEECILLKQFFGFSDAQVRLIVTHDIGDDRPFRKHFKI